MTVEHDIEPLRGGAVGFGRVWLLLGFSYVLLKLAFDLMVNGWIDLRGEALLELALVPLGQSAVFWLVTQRVGGQRTPGDDAAA